MCAPRAPHFATLLRVRALRVSCGYAQCRVHTRGRVKRIQTARRCPLAAQLSIVSLTRAPTSLMQRGTRRYMKQEAAAPALQAAQRIWDQNSDEPVAPDEHAPRRAFHFLILFFHANETPTQRPHTKQPQYDETASRHEKRAEAQAQAHHDRLTCGKPVYCADCADPHPHPPPFPATSRTQGRARAARAASGAAAAERDGRRRRGARRDAGSCRGGQRAARGRGQLHQRRRLCGLGPVAS